MPVELGTGLSVDEFLEESFNRECRQLSGIMKPKPPDTGD
jgi:hypothetical protein